MGNQVKLSIIVATYNQERYIAKAIQSVCDQRFDFPYEVFVGDDCSADGTAQVLREIEAACPDCYHFLYRENNLGVAKNNADMVRRSAGEYIIFLEGDDYYLEPMKLQKQVEFLDAHPEYVAVAHNTLVVDENGQPRKDFRYPECKKSEYTMEDFCEEVLAGQTATMMFRNFFRDDDYALMSLPFDYPGDQQKNFISLTKGKVAVIQKTWSAYRYVPESGHSYVANNKPTFELEMFKLRAVKAMYEYLICRKAPKEQIIPCERFYMKLVTRGVMVFAKGSMRMKDWFQAFIRCKYKGKTLAYLFQWQFNKRIRRR